MADSLSVLMQRAQTVLEDYGFVPIAMIDSYLWESNLDVDDNLAGANRNNMYTDDFGLPFASCHEEIATLNDELENRLQSIRERARTLAQQDPRNFSATLAARTLALVYNFLINCFLIYLFIQVDHLPAFDYTTCFEFLPGLR